MWWPLMMLMQTLCTHSGTFWALETEVVLLNGTSWCAAPSLVQLHPSLVGAATLTACSCCFCCARARRAVFDCEFS